MTLRSGSDVMICASLGAELVLYELDAAAATLRRQGSIRTPAYVQAGASHPTQPWLYAACSDGGPLAGGAGQGHFLAAYRIDAGALTQVGDAVRLTHRPVHICRDPQGAHVLAAYNDPADLTIHPVGPDGSVGPALAQPDRGLRRYPHQVAVSPGGELAVICARGNDATPTRPEDPGALHPFALQDGRIQRRLPITAPGDGFGFGPRNLDFHPTAPFAYVALERQNELHVYGYGAEGFDPAPAWVGSTLFGGASDAQPLVGMVRVHPNGRVVYVANRTMGAVEVGGEKLHVSGGNDIAVFAVSPSGEALTPLQRIDTQGVMPRTFAIDPSGTRMVVANHMPVTARDGAEMRHTPQSLVIFAIADDGRLSFLRKYKVEGSAYMFWMDMV